MASNIYQETIIKKKLNVNNIFRLKHNNASHPRVNPHYDISEGIGESLCLASLQHLFSLDLNLSAYANSRLLLTKCLDNKARWAAEEANCQEFLGCVLKIVGRELINEADREGYTPLMLAAANGKSGVVVSKYEM